MLLESRMWSDVSLLERLRLLSDLEAIKWCGLALPATRSMIFTRDLARAIYGQEVA